MRLAVPSASTSSTTDFGVQGPSQLLTTKEEYIVARLVPASVYSAMQRMPVSLMTPEALLAEWGRGSGLMGGAHGTAA